MYPSHHHQPAPPVYTPTPYPAAQPAPPPGPVNVNSVVVNAQPGSANNRLVVVEKHQLCARGWNSGLCGCLNDCGGCVLTTLCLPIAMCRLANRLHECALITCCVPGGYMALRTKLRIMGGIKGTLCDDFVLTTCCAPCTACQMHRELDDMGMK